MGAIALATAVGLAGCAAPAARSGAGETTAAPALVRRQQRRRLAPGQVELQPRSGAAITVEVELASTDPVRDRGLMHRRHLAPDHGMLFVFDSMEHRVFWMANTWIPLDMFFIDSRLRIVGVVQNAAPLTRDARQVAGRSQFVLEVAAGFAERHGLVAGDQVRFRGVAGYEQPSAEPGGHSERGEQ